MRSTKPRMTFTKHFFLFTFEISKASMLLSIEDVWVKTKENSYPVYILTRFLYCLYVENLNTCRWICNPFLEFSLILEIYFLGVNTFCLVFAFALGTTSKIKNGKISDIVQNSNSPLPPWPNNDK